MARHESTGAAQEDMEEVSFERNRAPQISGRMKHLLFGVRLTAVVEPLTPADDLDELARKLDCLRTRRVRHSC